MELYPVYGTAMVIIALFFAYLLSRKFDPFAPIWLFLVGYIQIYVIQATTCHDWAVQVRGPDLVMAANVRALWALIWFILIYHCGISRHIALRLPSAPEKWSPGIINALSPPLIFWGLVGAGLVMRGSPDGGGDSAARLILGSFAFVLLVTAICLIVTGRAGNQNRPVYSVIGVTLATSYVLIWMFNGKRSHSLMGVLACVCAFYIARKKRPSWPVLLSTAFMGILAVSIAIGWRFEQQRNPGQTVSRFVSFLLDFDMSTMLVNMSIDNGDEAVSHETEEYGGFLVMMTAVPSMSEYDYGASYLRTFSTFIPRIIWPSKPYYGREQWVNAWIAGSEFKRDSTFTGPAIGIHGATQLNGGAWGTAIVFACVAIFLRTAYDYFRLYEHCAWTQAWWASFFFNAWFMVVTDDPMVWFYYNWGFSAMPILVLLWFANKAGRASNADSAAGYGTWTKHPAA